jgi:hypothetical protein
VQAADRLERLEPAARFVEPTLVAWPAVAETAVALFELDGPLPSSDRLLVLVQGTDRVAREAPPGFVDVGRAGPGGARSAAVALAPMDDRRALRALGRKLADVADEGLVAVAFAVVSEDGTVHPSETMLGLRGRATARGLRVDAALGARLAWPRIPRLLAEPLARMLPARRPRPSWSADVADDDELRTIEERLEPWPEIECADEGSRVVCRSELTGSGLRRAWTRIIEPLIR